MQKLRFSFAKQLIKRRLYLKLITFHTPCQLIRCTGVFL